MRRSNLLWAGLLSLLLHAVLLALLWHQEPQPPASPPLPRPPLVVDLFTAPKPAPPAQPARPPPTQVPPRRRGASPPARPSGPVASSPPAPGRSEPQPPPGSSPPADAPLAAAEPRRPDLLPTTPQGGWSVPLEPEAPRGRTLRPGDPELAPESTEAEQARVSERVQGMAEDELARARAQEGLAPPYFGDMGKALAAQLEDAPPFNIGGLGERYLSHYLPQAEQFGATGTTAEPPPPYPTNLEQVQELARNEPAFQRLYLQLQAGEALQKFADGQVELVVIVELIQEVDGRLRSVRVIEASGDRKFDEYVIAQVPEALASLEPPPEAGPGVRPEGIRTRWAVEGRTLYLKRASELRGRDAAQLATAAALGLLAGRFDEVTGEALVVDLFEPKFVLRPRLLAIY